MTPIPQVKISARVKDFTTSFQLQLESPGEWFLDLFDSLDPAAVSISPFALLVVDTLPVEKTWPGDGSLSVKEKNLAEFLQAS
jgi:hypothetical protein